MSALAEIQDRIQSTSALISQYESAIAGYKGQAPASLPANIRSLEKLRNRLEREFLEVAQDQQMEVYRYRLLEETDRPTLAAVASAWAGFQSLFGEVYGAIGKTAEAAVARKGKKEKGSTVSVPQLGYAYTFPGSIGVVATIPREVRLIGESQLEQAANMVFDLIEARDVNRIARALGPGPIEALHHLIQTHIDNHFGIGLEWDDATGVRRKTEIQYPKLDSIRGIIADTTTEVIVTVTGMLQAVHMKDHTFMIEGDDGKEYKGTFTDAIRVEHAASVPCRYKATMSQVTKLILLGKEPKTTVILSSLSELEH
jgi:hypothetical protein